MRKTMVPAAGILALCLGAWAQAQPAGGAKEVRMVVENTVNGIIDVLKDRANDREARRRKIFAVVDPVTDFALMGKLALMSHWKDFDAAQQKEYTDSFSRTIRDSCFEKVEIYTNETVTYDEPAPSEKKFGMLIHIFSRGQFYKVLFKLYRSGSSWKIYDLEIEGVSLIRTYMAQYDQVLQKGKPRDLLDKMRTKALATPDGLKKAGQSKSGKN